MRPNWVKSPRNEFPVREKVKEYPQKNHWKLMTATDIMDNRMSVRADLRRARPL